MLLCARTDSLSEEHAEPGSIRQWCMFCADEVWLSPDGQRFAEEKPSLKLVCTECAIGLMAHDPRDFEVEVIPGVMLPEEMKALAIYILKQLAAERAES